MQSRAAVPRFPRAAAKAREKATSCPHTHREVTSQARNARRLATGTLGETGRAGCIRRVRRSSSVERATNKPAHDDWPPGDEVPSLHKSQATAPLVADTRPAWHGVHVDWPARAAARLSSALRASCGAGAPTLEQASGTGHACGQAGVIAVRAGGARETRGLRKRDFRRCD
jgi:hypothetical protein